jgi:pilus assembly protein CpaE
MAPPKILVTEVFMERSEKIKILVVENIPQMQKQLKKLLSLIENIDVVAELTTGQDAVEAIREGKPEVALIDLNLPDMNGVRLVETIRGEFPFTQALLLSQDKNYNTMLAAMRSGASDFLTHDVTLEELTAAIRRAGEQALADQTKSHPYASTAFVTGEPIRVEPEGPSGRIITVYSPKGGAGVTSVAINLAIALQDKETTVGLVDSSIQFGDVPILLNELSRFSLVDLVPRVSALDPKMIEDTMLFHKSSGLHILTAPPRPELSEKVTGNHVSQILEFMRQMFQYIVVNTSSFISDPCLAGLDAADVILLLTTPEISAIRNTRSFLELWDGLNMNLERVMLTINRFDTRKNITPEKVGESLKHPVSATLPLDEETAYRAVNYGIPFMLGSKDSAIAKGMDSLAELVQERILELEGAERIRLFSVA